VSGSEKEKEFLSIEYIELIMNNINNIISVSKKEYKNENNIIEGRLNPFIKNKKIMLKYFDIYKFLYEIRYIIESELSSEKPSKLIDLSFSIICELFLTQTPDMEMLEKVVKEDTDDFANIFRSQPLLDYRIREIAGILNNNTKTPIYFIGDLDRMRNARNLISHEGKAVNTLEILTQRFYKYSRIYIREIIHNLVTDTKKSIREIMCVDKI